MMPKGALRFILVIMFFAAVLFALGPSMASDQKSKAAIICDKTSREDITPSTKNAHDLCDRCYCYLNHEDLTNAKSCFEKVLSICSILTKKNPSDQAVLDLQTTALDGIAGFGGDITKLPPGWNCTCQKNNSYSTVIAGYDNITRQNPDNIRAWNNKGALLAELCCSAEANESFEKALELNSSAAEAWYNKGLLLYYSDPREALKCFNRSLEIDPSLAEAWLNKYSLLVPKQIDFANSASDPASVEAIKCYKKALELRPDLEYYLPPYLIYRRMD